MGIGKYVRSLDGLPVMDAKHDLELHVTARDCANGNPKEPSTCAAARTLRREHGVLDCKVHLSRVYVRQNKGNWVRYTTPPALQREIVSFDRNGTFEPGVYVLKPLKPSALKARGRSTSRTRKKQRPTTRAGRAAAPGKGRNAARMLTKNVRNGPAYGNS